MGKGKNNEELFRSMPVAQAILTLAVPTVVSQIITIIYNMADTFFIGQLGDPKQVEPVVTDDQDVLKQTYTEDMFKLYADKTNSVQRFADLMNPYGTYLENDQGAQEWVGANRIVAVVLTSQQYASYNARKFL